MEPASFGLYYGAAMLFLLRYMASGRSGLTFRIVPLRGALFADMLKVGIPTALNAMLTNLTVRHRRGRPVRDLRACRLGHFLPARLHHDSAPVRRQHGNLTMVGVNRGAGETARAHKIGWISGVVGLVLTGTVGLTVAIFPTAWLQLFSHDTEVVREGTTYLRIVAPAYSALGLGFVVAFAVQGAGRAMWPLAGALARTLIAAGGGWIAVASFGAKMTGLVSMVRASLVAYAAVCAAIMLLPSIWRPEPR